jgi:hypothetical protein
MLIVIPWSLQSAGELVAGELAALVGVEEVRPAVVGKCLIAGMAAIEHPRRRFFRRGARTARLTQYMTTTR